MTKKNKKVAVTRKRKQPTNKELGLLARALRAGGGGIGGALGSFFGPSGTVAGSSIGSSLGAQLSKWLGAGDYTLSSNSLVEKAAKGVPMMHFNDESTIIRHREYIGEVVTGAANTFSAATFQINPGLSATFPWLSGIAQQYQEYSFKGLVFHYVSTSGDSVGSTTTSLPVVMMATQYKGNSTTFTDKVSLLNSHFASDARASEDFCHPVECDPRENPFNVQYVRGAAPPVGDDIMMYDLGKFTIATTGSQAANVTVGELWATYEVELKKPLATEVSNTYSETAFLTRTGATNSAFFGTAGAGGTIDNIGITFPSATTMLFPTGITGSFLITVYYPQFTACNTTLSTTVTNGIRLGRWGVSGLGVETVTVAAAASSGYTYTVLVNIPDNTKACSIQFTGGTVTGTSIANILVAAVASTI